MLATSVIFFVLFKKLTAATIDITESDNRTENEKLDAEVKNRKKYLVFIVGVGKCFQYFGIVYAFILGFREL